MPRRKTGRGIPPTPTPLPPRHMSETKFNLFEDQVKDMIIKSKRPPPGWSHKPALDGDNERLAEKIPTLQRTRPPSLEKTAFISSDTRGLTGPFGDSDEGTSDLSLEPGSFVEIRRAHSSSHGIILGSYYVNRMEIFLALTTQGEIWEHKGDDVAFEVPSLVPSDLALRCGHGDVAANKNELKARVEVLKALKSVQKETEDAMNLLISRGMDVYEAVREKGESSSNSLSGDYRWGSTTVSEVARILQTKPLHRPNKEYLPHQASFTHLLAAHKYLISNSRYFVVSHDFVTSKRFGVRPLADVNRIKDVEKWTQTENKTILPDGTLTGPIEQFVEKVKRIMQKNKLSTDGSPSRTLSRTHTWSSNDLTILFYLCAALRPTITVQPDPFPAVQYILKRIYDRGDVADEIVHQLLVDIGAMALWEDTLNLRLTSSSPELETGQHWTPDSDTIVERASAQREIQQASPRKSTSTYNPAGQVLGPEDFYSSDPVEALRHDFGDMPVYVIDDIDAKELDDGISVEKVHDQPDQIWVHTHIADPTSILPPTHILAKRADILTTSMYFYHGTYPMLPRSFTHHPSYGSSLGSTADQSKGQPTLTFSVKVDLTSAAILDYVVRPGVVRNTVTVDYTSVDKVLGMPINLSSYPFGGAPETNVDANAALLRSSPRFIEDLHLLHRVSEASVARRYREGIFIQTRTQAEICNIEWPSFDTPFPSSTTTELLPYTYSGFPSSVYRVYQNTSYDFGAHSIVAECMKLASRTASMYCRDRKIPILRRFSSIPTVDSEKALVDILDARSKSGHLGNEGFKLGKHIISDTVAAYTTELKGHWGLGIPEDEGYVRCTSPLRRYADMVIHWQIKKALLDEWNGRRAPQPLSSSEAKKSLPASDIQSEAFSVLSGSSSPSSSTSPSFSSFSPLFSKEWFEDFAVRNKASERIRKRAGGQHQAWWTTAWLMRWTEKHYNGYEFLNVIAKPSTTASPTPKDPNSSNPDPFRSLSGFAVGIPEQHPHSRKWQVNVLIQALGIKAIMVNEDRNICSPGGRVVADGIKDLEIGTEVEIDISGMRLGAKPQVQVVPKKR
ncbi:hypothetical protein BDP27DRAFT_1425133 [Rhodocollybia butyracea]|uniref:RNB domain-containing protein n=1 Tax=Rhodocollybia butyracea TaxID=206335 RepID=A0A9P5PM63_9AGAR|nr:hypothetical protein BDP27DRAFT_1425133 [Rhodocollybia butyracea]